MIPKVCGPVFLRSRISDHSLSVPMICKIVGRSPVIQVLGGLNSREAIHAVAVRFFV